MKTHTKKIFDKEMTRREFLVFSMLAIASIFGVVGLIRELLSHAATTATGIEPETGTKTGPASSTNDSTASNDGAIKFGPGITAFILGTTRPIAANSGIAVNSPSLTVVTASSGDTITHSTNNAIYNNMDFRCYVNVTGKAVTYNNCRFTGPASPSSKPYGLLYSTGISALADRPTLNFCTLRPTVPVYYLNCIKGGVVVNRCDLSGGTDILNNGGTTQIVTATGCFMHDVTVWDGSAGTEHASDSRFPGATHNDMFEVFGGTGHSFEGCNMLAYFNTSNGNPNSFKPWSLGGTGNGITYPNNNYCNGITVAARVGVTSGTLTNNWMDGGEINFQAPAQGVGFDSGHNWVFRGNRFGLGQHPYGGNSYQQIRYTNGMGTFDVDASNVYDTIANVPLAHQGKSLNSPNVSSNQTTYALTL